MLRHFYGLMLASFFITNISHAAVGGWNWNVNLNGTNYSSGTNLGSFDSDNLTLRGGWGNTWQNGGDDTCHIVFEYSVSNGGVSGQLVIDYVSPHGGNPGDKYHSNQNYNINISNLTEGNYTLNIVYKIYGRHSGTTCGTPGNNNEFTTAGLASQTFDFSINGPLPVKLTTFNVENKGSANILQWETYYESNNHYFEVQRADKSMKFQSIGIVHGNGNSYDINKYEFADIEPVKGINYYRLRQVDFDGRSEYTNILNIKNIKSVLDMDIFPNPTQNLFYISGLEGVNKKVIIMDNFGRPVKKFSSENQTVFDVQDLLSGVYLIHICSDTGIFNFQLVKSE